MKTNFLPFRVKTLRPRSIKGSHGFHKCCFSIPSGEGSEYRWWLDTPLGALTWWVLVGLSVEMRSSVQWCQQGLALDCLRREQGTWVTLRVQRGCRSGTFWPKWPLSFISFHALSWTLTTTLGKAEESEMVWFTWQHLPFSLLHPLPHFLVPIISNCLLGRGPQSPSCLGHKAVLGERCCRFCAVCISWHPCSSPLLGVVLALSHSLGRTLAGV